MTYYEDLRDTTPHETAICEDCKQAIYRMLYGGKEWGFWRHTSSDAHECYSSTRAFPDAATIVRHTPTKEAGAK